MCYGAKLNTLEDCLVYLYFVNIDLLYKQSLILILHVGNVQPELPVEFGNP